jgi:hypothetical protein
MVVAVAAMVVAMAGKWWLRQWGGGGDGGGGGYVASGDGGGRGIRFLNVWYSVSFFCYVHYFSRGVRAGDNLAEHGE